MTMTEKMNVIAAAYIAQGKDVRSAKEVYQQLQWWVGIGKVGAGYINDLYAAIQANPGAPIVYTLNETYTVVPA